jgi:hypothetical protein
VQRWRNWRADKAWRRPSSRYARTVLYLIIGQTEHFICVNFVRQFLPLAPADTDDVDNVAAELRRALRTATVRGHWLVLTGADLNEAALRCCGPYLGRSRAPPGLSPVAGGSEQPLFRRARLLADDPLPAGQSHGRVLNDHGNQRRRAELLAARLALLLAPLAPSLGANTSWRLSELGTVVHGGHRLG